jgi:prepilin-type N-terminal cleavage/methylation domain-containing protein/prepilin-type processing-associated H-X9-DG protein
VGFTLVELLTVIAIIGVLIALLLPAIQSARESARRVHCGNNIRQLALGCQQHLTQQGFFPSGGWGWCWTGDPDRGFGKSQPGSWAFSVLPFIEQTTIFSMAGDGDPDTVSATQQSQADAAARMPVATFSCPTRRPAVTYPTPNYATSGLSMRNAATPTQANRSDYKLNGGSVLVIWFAGPSLTDGVAGIGFHDMTQTNGLAAQRSEGRAAHIRDGLSNTYLLGEKYLNPANYTTGEDICDDHSMFAGDYYDPLGFTDVPPAQDLRGDVNNVRFGSAHAGGFNMAMADGSTQFVGYDISAAVHSNRGNRKDGQATQ